MKFLFNIKSLLIALFITVNIQVSFSQDIYSIDNSVNYANYLFKSKEYSLAAKEMERIMFFDSTKLDLQLKLVQCYRLSGNYEKAFNYISSAYPSVNQLDNNMSIEYSKLLINSNNFDQELKFIDNSNMSNTDKLFFKSASYSLKTDWNNANNTLLGADINSSKYLLNLKKILIEQQTLKYKKVGLAMSMSAIVPGSGKIYTGNWKDGLFSLIVTSMSGIQAYRGFKKNGIQSTYGWIYLGFGTGFYIGNIYGTGKAANKINKELNHKILHQIEDIISTYN